MTTGLGGLGLWVRSEWRQTWRSLVGIALIVALGGGLAIAAVAGARRASTAFERLADAARTRLTVSSDGPTSETADESSIFQLAEDLAGLDGVEGVMPVAWIAVGLDAPGLDEIVFAGVAGTTIGVRPPTLGVIDEGRPLDPGADDEVVINAEAARVSGLGVGDTVLTRTLSPDQYEAFAYGGYAEQPDGPTFEVQIVGIYRTVEDIADLPAPFAILSSGVLDRYGDEVAHCRCNLFVNAPSEAIPAITALIESTAPNASLTVNETDGAALSRVVPAVSMEANALRIAAVVAALASLLVVSQAIDRHLSERRRAWTALSAIGVVRRQLVAGWLAVMLPVLALGAVLAVTLAAALSPLFPRGIARVAEPEPGMRVDPVALGLGLASILLVTSVVVAAITFVRTSPRSPGTARRPFIVSWLANVPPPVALGAGFAIDPARDRRGVSGFGAVLGLGLAVAGVMAVTLVDSSIDELLSTPSAYAADWNLEMPEQPPDIPEAIRRTLAEPSVEALAIVWQAGGTTFSLTHGDAATTETATALEVFRGSIGPTIDTGRSASAPDDVMLGTATADDLDADVGDEITFRSRTGDDERFVVSGIGRMADTEDSDRFTLMTMEGLTRLLPATESGDADGLDPNGAFVRTTSTDAESTEPLRALGWSDVRPPAKSANLGQIGDVPALLAAALSALGLAGLVNSLLVALRRRRDDLAITRAIGFTTRQSAATVRWQGVTTAALALVVGIPVGIVAGRSIWRLLADGAGVVDLATIPWIAIAVTPIVVLAVVTAIGTLLGRRAARLRAAAILRSE